MKRIAVIGAGAAGLASARWLIEAGLDPVVLERGHGIGGLWRPDTGLAYPSLRTNTSKQKSAFSDLPFDDALPDHPSRDQVQAYLERYADLTGVRSRVSFGHEVRAVRRQAGGWSVDGDVFDAVVVASGLFARTVEPALAGRDGFGGIVVHSRDYRDPAVFADRDVVVAGAGSSGADIAVELAGVARSVTLAVRKPPTFTPRHHRGRPYDHRATRLAQLLPRRLRRWRARRLVESEYRRRGLRFGRLSVNTTPGTDVLDALAAGRITLAPALVALEADAAVLADGSRVRADAIVLATGYLPAFPFLPSGVPATYEGALALYRLVFPPGIPGLAFVGMTRVSGPVFPVAELQARWVAAVFADRVALPSEQEMWREIHTRIDRARAAGDDQMRVELLPYLDDIASRIGAKPSLLRHPRLLTSPVSARDYMLAVPRRTEGPSSIGPRMLAVDAEQIAGELRPKVRASMGEVRAGLERLARVPSMSATGYDPAAVRESARVTAELFTAAGVTARVVEKDGAHPAVVGRVDGPSGSPTVLLYAHHDVQPPGPKDRWTSDPFTPTERGGRLYGRGVADDKAGIAAHLAALRTFGGRPPCGVALFIEGEEESGSVHLVDFLKAEKDTLRCDAVIIADSANWRIGQPAITTTLRGNALVTVELRVSDHAVHSGGFGGAAPDALMAMSRLLASLHDDLGRVAVPGLKTGDADPLDLKEDELRGWVGTRPSVKLIGDGSLTSRLWTKPSISIIGLDATPVNEASNTLWPVATARLSMRVPPGQDAKAAQDALVKHLESHAPWGAELKITRGPTGEAFTGATTGPAYDALKSALGAAWGTKAIDIGQGGSIPFLFDFAKAFPGAALLVTGVEDPESNAHSENESLHLAEFENVCVAEATFLALFGAMKPERG